MKIKILIAFIVLLSAKSAFAADLGWVERIQPFLSKAGKEKNCQAMWNILWPEAKAGNLQARFALFVYLLPMMHHDRIIPPGHSDDFITRMRDSLIMSVHSSGVRFEEKSPDEGLMEGAIYSIMLRKDLHDHKSFLDCVATENSQHCAEIAIQNDIVPSFEEYAAEIETFVGAGAKPSCNFLAEDAVDISPQGD